MLIHVNYRTKNVLKLRFKNTKLKKKIKKTTALRNIIIQAISQNPKFLKKTLQILHGAIYPKSPDLNMRYF